jgi:hypothetical protein
MPRKKRVSKAKEQLSDMQWRFLKGEELPATMEAFAIKKDFHGTNEALWNQYREVILAEHVKQNPGTRPALFWKYDCPRLPMGTFPGCFYDGKLPEPRKRLGGVGTPDYLVKCTKPSFSYGIADIWAGIDEDDPPIFESQAAYLKRHGLLMAGEERRSDFASESVPKSQDWWPELVGKTSEIAARRK